MVSAVRSHVQSLEEDPLFSGPGPWTLMRAILARRCTPEADELLKDCGYTSREIELARWTLLGRSNQQALELLNGTEGGGVKSPAVAAE